MLFIHQQIQSFLQLGECKEYPIMAKPRTPKKNAELTNTGLPPTVSATSSPVPTNGNSAAAAAPALDTKAPATATKKTAARKTAPKPEIVKAEPRANLVPINLDDEIRQLAYLFSERRGFEPGHEAEDWVAAENEIRQRYRQHSA
jgi:DUF2934 family protein